MAVILIAWSLFNFLNKKNEPVQVEEEVIKLEEEIVLTTRHQLNGQEIPVDDAKDFFPIAIMIDNAYNVRPQAGLDQADIIYEALSEGNITRLLAIFDSSRTVDKIGPIRSARNYYMDWAEEYSGLYVHVGGSPQALLSINKYDFVNVDQIGAGEIYFWRDENLDAPHNVFSSSANWLRAGELKDVDMIDHSEISLSWNYENVNSTTSSSVVLAGDSAENINLVNKININFANSYYEVDWQYNKSIKKYQRWQGGDKFYFNTGTQAVADNIIVQVVKDYLIDVERRGMNTQEGGLVYIFNNHGYQTGAWLVEDGRTRFFDAEGQELKLVPGKTWVEIINNKERLEFE